MEERLTREQVYMVNQLQKGTFGVDAYEKFKRGLLTWGTFIVVVRFAIASAAAGAIVKPTNEQLKRKFGNTNLIDGKLPSNIHAAISFISLRYGYTSTSGDTVDDLVWKGYSTVPHYDTANTANVPAMPWAAALLNSEINVNVGNRSIIHDVPGNAFNESYKLAAGSEGTGINLTSPKFWKADEKLDLGIQIGEGAALASGSNVQYGFELQFRGVSLEERA